MTNNSINGQLGSYVIAKSVTLSSAQILASSVTPIEIITAPGAGKLVLVFNAELILFFNSIAYTGAGAPRLIYASGSPTLGFDNGTIVASASTQQGVQPNTGTIAVVNINNALNFSSSSAFSAGNSTARIDVIYQIMDMA